MSKSLPWLFSFIFLIGNNPLFAQSSQEATALMVEFTHQTTTPEAYPNYFQTAQQTDSLMAITKKWIQKTFGATTVDYKLKNPINFQPYMGENRQVRSIAHTYYDFAVSIISTLESGIDAKKMKSNEGTLSFKVEVMGKDGQNLFRNQVKIAFKIIQNDSLDSEIMISATDFSNMYLQGLQSVFKQTPKPKPFVFKQPSDDELNNLLAQSDLYSLQRTDRATFELIKDENKEIFEIKLKTPQINGDRYERYADFQNPFWNLNLNMEGHLESIYPADVFVKFMLNQEPVGYVKFSEKTEGKLMIGKINQDEVWMMRSESTNFIKMKVNQQLWAVLKYQSGSLEQNDRYDLYLPRNATAQQKALLANIMMAEGLGDAVKRFYEVENRK
jgi:hypothetical protein